jgi:hypothetical protein
MINMAEKPVKRVRYQKRSLTPLEQRFVVAYAEDGNAISAYRKACSVNLSDDDSSQKHLSRSYPYKILSRPRVKAEIERLVEDKRKAVDTEVLARDWLQRDWVTKELRATYDAAVKADDLSARVQTLGLMGKAIGMYSDNVNVGVTEAVQEYTRAQLEENRRIARLLLTGDTPAIIDATPVQALPVPARATIDQIRQAEELAVDTAPVLVDDCQGDGGGAPQEDGGESGCTLSGA